eukprot:m.526478 g.526478  ORF g.526478 m.526478 type:complete len:93 (+) comp22001_c0_seq51:2251-2529(+)
MVMAAPICVTVQCVLCIRLFGTNQVAVVALDFHPFLPEYFLAAYTLAGSYLCVVLAFQDRSRTTGEFHAEALRNVLLLVARTSTRCGACGLT